MTIPVFFVLTASKKAFIKIIITRYNFTFKVQSYFSVATGNNFTFKVTSVSTRAFRSIDFIYI